MSKPFDATLNSLIDAHADEWAAFLAARVGLPLGPASPIDTDLSVTLQADRLFRIDGPDPAVLHLELESSGRLGIPVELLRYNVAAFGVTGLPVASVLVLLRPKATATDLTGRLDVPLAGRVYLTFEYTVVRLWQEPMNSFLTAGVGLAPLAMLTNEAASDLDVAFERLRDRLRQPDVPRNVAEVLFGSTFVLSGLRYDRDQILTLYRRLNMTLEDSTTYQWIEEQGGTKQSRKLVARLGLKRFGPLSLQAEAALNGVADLARLERMAERIFDATGWDDLLATE